MGRKFGRGLRPLLGEGELGPRLTQCGQGRGLPACQVSSWSIQPFGHSAPTLQTYRIGQTGQRSDSIGRTVLQTVTQTTYKTRNALCGTWYLHHSWVHYDEHCQWVFMPQLLAYLHARNKLPYFYFRSEIWRHCRVPRPQFPVYDEGIPAIRGYLRHRNWHTPCPEKNGTTTFLSFTLPNQQPIFKMFSPTDLLVNFWKSDS